MWMSFIGSTNINISWDPDDVDDSEYSSVVLYFSNKNVEVDMLKNSYYEFTCPPWTSQEFTINCTINQAPIAGFTYEPSDPSTADTIYFNSTSYDTDGSIVNWTWDFDDGDVGYGEFVTHQYIDDGSYDVEGEIEKPQSFHNSYSLTSPIAVATGLSGGGAKKSFRRARAMFPLRSTGGRSSPFLCLNGTTGSSMKRRIRFSISAFVPSKSRV